MASRASYGEREAEFPNHESFINHARYRWLKFAIFLSIAAVVATFFALAPTGFRIAHFGATWLGYTLGTIGALIMVWLTMIGIRKRAMTSGHWSLKAWVSAHVYLGLSLTVIITLHSGLQFGLNIHTLAYVLMLLVISSGVFGLVAYANLPVALSDARGDMTKVQMLETIRSLDHRIHDAAQSLDGRQAQIAQLSLDETMLGGGLWRRLFSSYRRCGNRRALARLPRVRGKAQGAQAEALDKIEDLLQRKEEVLATARHYSRIRAYLESWLFVHIPATFAMLAAVTAHIVSVFFYF